jgi:hypothetical protein
MWEAHISAYGTPAVNAIRRGKPGGRKNLTSWKASLYAYTE